MTPRHRQRLYQSIAVLAVVAVGLWAWSRIVRPDKDLLVRLAREKLEAIFGARVTDHGVEVNPIEDVTILGLRVESSLRGRPAFSAESVRIQHDIVALASGIYRPEVIEIVKPVIVTQETPDGVELAFPFQLEPSDTSAGLPSIRVRDGTLYYTSMEGSKRLRDKYVLVLEGIQLDVWPEGGESLGITGRFRTRGLGQDSVWITVGGRADVAADTLRLRARWSPLVLTSYLLEHLAKQVADRLAGQEGKSGVLTVELDRNPSVAEGRLRVHATWEGEVKLDPGTLPGTLEIDAQSREQIKKLLSDGTLKLDVGEGSINVQNLVTSLGTGEMRANGRIEEGGKFVRLYIQIEGVRLEDPALRDALGNLGTRLYDSFDPAGEVDAFVQVRKDRGKDLRWDIDAFIQDGSFRYVGLPDEHGQPAGFPYPVVQATGSVHVSGGRIWFEGIEGRGRNHETTVRLRGPEEHAWTGGETGRIIPTDEGVDVRMTVEAHDVPVDDDLEAAIQGSEFADLRSQFLLEGVLDRVLVDVISVPGRDQKAYAEVRVDMKDERFRYARFPLQLEGVTGWLTLRRPFIGRTKRGEVFDFDVTGVADGAAVHLDAKYDAHGDAGRLHVEGKDVSLGGALRDAVLHSQATQGALAKVWRYLDPRGHADVTMDVPLGDAATQGLALRARLLGASIRLGATTQEHPIEVQDLRGTLRATGDVVTLDGLRGRIGNAAVTVDGKVEGGPEGRWDVVVHATGLTVTDDLLEGLRQLGGGEPLLPRPLQLEPGATLDLNVHVRREPGPARPLSAEVEASDVNGVLRLPGGLRLAVTGQRLSVKEDAVELEGVEAEAPGIHLHVEHARAVGGNLSGRFRLGLEDYAPSEDVLALLPESLRPSVASFFEGRRLTSDGLSLDVGADGGVGVSGDLKVLAEEGGPAGNAPRGTLVAEGLMFSPPDAQGERDVAGRIRFQGFSFGDVLPVTELDGWADVQTLHLGEDLAGSFVLHGRTLKVLDVRVQDLEMPAVWQDGILTLDPLTGVVAEGRLHARVRVHTREPVAYEGDARIDTFRLESLREDLAPTGPPVSGRGDAHFAFQNRSGDLRDLTGAGQLRVRDGNLGDLPVAATVFALLAKVFHVPDPPRFERADLDFTLSNEVLHFRRFDLAGPLFEMPGKGTLDLGGFVDLTFTPDFIKSFALPGIMQFPVVGPALDALLREDLLYAVRIRGDLATAEPEIVPLPPLGLSEDEPFEGTGVPKLPRRRLPGWFR